MFNQLILTAIPDFPLVNIGSDLGQMISEGLKRANIVPEQGDIVVIAQKVVSKAEGRTVDLNTVVPSSAACELAADTGKDPLPEFKKSIFMARKFKNVQILWASVREPYNYLQAKQSNCHIITVPPLTINKIEKFGKTFDQLTKETVKAFLIDSKKSKFKI